MTCFCTRCRDTKPASEFSPAFASKGRGWCRRCSNEHRKNIRNGITPKRSTTNCLSCGKDLSGSRRHARFCSKLCNAQGWRDRHPGGQRGYRIKCEYGITLEQFEELLRKQGGCCAICKTSEPRGIGIGWQIDHDHGTGEIRGILCSPCNVGIGQLRDNADTLRAAWLYLRRHEQRKQKRGCQAATIAEP